MFLQTAYNNNKNGESIIAYCFADIPGYCKSGSYVANENSDGNFVFTGFKPQFIIMKRIDADGYNWVMMDHKINGFNEIQ